jgi:hypothetical protein
MIQNSNTMGKISKETDNEDNIDDHSGNDDDDSNSRVNANPLDNNAAIDDSSNAGAAAADDAVDASVAGTSSIKKRAAIDESTLNAEDLQKLESRRAYNRHCAAKGTVSKSYLLVFISYSVVDSSSISSFSL